MRFSFASALVVALAAETALGSTWFTKAAYNKWHETELERWLSDHDITYPKAADRKELQDLVKTNWQSVVASPYANWDASRLQKYLSDKGEEVKHEAEASKDTLLSQVKASWYESEEQASNAYTSVKDWIFDSWSESQIKAFLDKHGIPSPQPHKRDTLLKTARESYQTIAEKTGETSSYPGNWLWENWSNSDLKAFLDARGIPVPQHGARDKLIASVRRNARLSGYQAEAAASSASASLSSLSSSVAPSVSSGSSVLSGSASSAVSVASQSGSSAASVASKSASSAASLASKSAKSAASVASKSAKSAGTVVSGKASSALSVGSESGSSAASSLASVASSKAKSGASVAYDSAVSGGSVFSESAKSGALAFSDAASSSLSSGYSAASSSLSSASPYISSSVVSAASGASASASSVAVNAKDYLSSKLLDAWSDSELKGWFDKNAIKVPQGSTRNELLALARKHSAKLSGDNLSAKATSAFHAATTSAGNEFAKATHGAALNFNYYLDLAYSKAYSVTDELKILAGIKTNYASSASRSVASASKSASSVMSKVTAAAKGEL